MHLCEINIFPVKSLKGISVTSATVEPRGLRNDRRWMLIDADGRFMTQREFPQMATIGVVVTGDGLQVTSEGAGVMRIPFEPGTGDIRQVTIWQSVCDAEIYGDVVNQWFSDVLGTPCQVVYMPDETKRSVNSRFDRGEDIVSFADGYPLLVISEASLEDLNDRIAESLAHAGRLSAFRQLPMNRFRPNIVVAGSEAFAEDHWRRIRVGEAIFRATKPCARCAITTVDQSRGQFDGKEPLKTLASYRMAQHVIPDTFESLGMTATAVLFGQNLIAESIGATIKAGDEVSVIE